MSTYLTSITVVGRIVNDPRYRTVSMAATGNDVTNFRLVSSERRFDRERNEWVDGKKLFVDVTCWGPLARNVAASLRKGDPVMVTGRLHSDEYEFDGQKRTTVVLTANAVGPDLGWSTVTVTRTKRAVTTEPANAPASTVTEPREVRERAGYAA